VVCFGEVFWKGFGYWFGGRKTVCELVDFQAMFVPMIDACLRMIFSHWDFTIMVILQALVVVRHM
jgi:hypothetical protein